MDHLQIIITIIIITIITKKDQEEVMRMYSKDIEHSDENMESLYETFESAEAFKEEELLIMLMS